MRTLVFVAAGGACGAVARFGVVTLSGRLGLQFPWGTLAANVIGCFAIGLLMGACADAAWFRDYGRAFLVVGILGAFTTFSAFSMETILLIDGQQWGLAGAYVLASVTICLVAAWAGQTLAG